MSNRVIDQHRCLILRKTVLKDITPGASKLEKDHLYYEIKNSGRNSFVFFVQSLRVEIKSFRDQFDA